MSELLVRSLSSASKIHNRAQSLCTPGFSVFWAASNKVDNFPSILLPPGTTTEGLRVLVKPQVSDPVLRVKLSKGMGHNTYGEIAWPNDLLYMFPVCILGVLGISTSLAVLWHPPSEGRPVSPSRRQAT